VVFFIFVKAHSQILIKRFSILYISALVFISSLYFFNTSTDINVDGGVSVRNLHLSSIVTNINHKPSIMLFGSGPGSRFYTSGFEAFTDNIEISQLEILRKYGLLFFILIHLILLRTVTNLFRSNNIELVFAIFGYYIVSFSNPVLMSTPFILFFAYCNLRLKNLK
jgi:hypothetical protein